jgi:hypothetical protein
MNDPIITTTLQRIQTDPQGEAPIATAFFEQKTVIDGQVFVAPWTPVSWPLRSEKTVTVDGNTYTYAEVSAAVTAIAYQEYNETTAAPTAAPTA